MNKNFYLQHSLMAMHDPRMKHLVDEEGFKGIGAYWFIIEKLSLLPEPCARLEYLRPFCRGKKMSLAYLKKVIFEYQLFSIDEEGTGDNTNCEEIECWVDVDVMPMNKGIELILVG